MPHMRPSDPTTPVENEKRSRGWVFTLMAPSSWNSKEGESTRQRTGDEEGWRRRVGWACVRVCIIYGQAPSKAGGCRASGRAPMAMTLAPHLGRKRGREAKN